MHFRYGIEHEVAFLRPNGEFADYANTSYRELAAIVAALPTYEQDYPGLRVGDAGIKVKRWYVEGFERFAESGEVVDCPPKGIEIRTTVHDSISGAVDELKESFAQLTAEAEQAGFTPALVSFHPYRTEFVPDPPLNAFEQQRRLGSPEMQTAHIPMLTHGPDLNLSAEELTPAELIEVGRKLTYYSPYLLPFSFSSPFYEGRSWGGLSARTFQRTGPRPAAMVFLAEEEKMLESCPSLTQLARLPEEIGRIEFKAFDSCSDFDLYASLLVLLKGLILDRTLPGRATVPDRALHQHSARRGFGDRSLLAGTKALLEAAEKALADDPDLQRLQRLKTMLTEPSSPADAMLQAYSQGQPIEEILQKAYCH